LGPVYGNKRHVAFEGLQPWLGLGSASERPGLQGSESAHRELCTTVIFNLKPGKFDDRADPCGAHIVDEGLSLRQLPLVKAPLLLGLELSRHEVEAVRKIPLDG